MDPSQPPVFASNPKEFLTFLRAIISSHLAATSEFIPDNTKEPWLELISGLSEHFFLTFPLPSTEEWGRIPEQIESTSLVVKFAERLLKKVKRSLGDELEKLLVLRLLSLCLALESWKEVVTEGYEGAGPHEIENDALSVLVELVKRDRKRIEHLISKVQELINSVSTMSFPHSMQLFDRQTHGQDVQNEFKITTSSFLPTTIATLCCAIIGALPHTSPDLYVVCELRRQAAETAYAAFTFVFSPACVTTNAKRMAALTQLAHAASKLPINEAISSNMLYHIFRLRLSFPDSWTPLLERHAEDILLSVSDLGRKILTGLIIQNISNTNSMDPNVSAVIKTCLPCLAKDEKIMQELRDAVKPYEQEDSARAILQSLDSYRTEKMDIDMEHPSWRDQIERLLQEIIFPDIFENSEEEDALADALFVWKVTQSVKERFERPLSSDDADSRIQLCANISKLSCLLSKCPSDGQHIQSAYTHGLLPSSLGLIARLFDLSSDAETSATNEAKRKIYATLRTLILHHPYPLPISNESGNGEDVEMEILDETRSADEDMPTKHLSDTIIRGVVDKDRGVRLSSGSALRALISYHAKHPGSKGHSVTENIFDELYALIEKEKFGIKETMLVTIGSIGRETEGEVLGQVLCFLVAQLGKANPVIRGVACMQILSIAKQHGKQPYPLFLPYMSTLAPYIVVRHLTCPSLLNEFCRLATVAPRDFISTTLSRTLPHIVAACDKKVLESVLRETGRDVVGVFVKNEREILSHIFLMMKPPGATAKSMAFLVAVLQEAAGPERSQRSSSGSYGSRGKDKEGGRPVLDACNIVKSGLVQLLAELVVVLGDEVKQTRDSGISALKKVERTVAEPTKRSSSEKPINLADFLSGHVLGIVSDLNDMLQDVQGKKSVEAKRKILRGLGELIVIVGEGIHTVAPQVMATFQTMIAIPELAEVALGSWFQFLTTLSPSEVGSHVGPTSAAIASSWNSFFPAGRMLARKIMNYLLVDIGEKIKDHLDEVVDFSGKNMELLSQANKRLTHLRRSRTPKEHLRRILGGISSDNMTVASQTLLELKKLMLHEYKSFIRELASGDVFDPLVGQTLVALFSAANRDTEGTGFSQLRPLAMECLGILGAVDPDRCELDSLHDSKFIIVNFEDINEAVYFAMHLITELLVGQYKSTSDIRYQSHLAYSIQELLKYCGFSPKLVSSTIGPKSSDSVPLKVRNRWNSLSKHVLETVTPLLNSHFTLDLNEEQANRRLASLAHPIYPNQSTYREWIQIWASFLISRVQGDYATKSFGVFRSCIKNKDVSVAHHLLPHLILNVLISGAPSDSDKIRLEILAVLEDHVQPATTSTGDKRLLSAQAVFGLLDHLNKWVRKVRQMVSSKKVDNKRARENKINSTLEEQLLKVDSILSSIDQNLMARAALQCRSYARALMNFEQQIVSIKSHSGSSSKDLAGHYEKLHEIYAHLDEPDGMEGVSTLILAPSLEHQIRQHESTGRWTSAQSCWEVRLQESPDNVELHVGLLRCLRNLGHYDTLRTHVQGVLTRKPDWEGALAGFHIESSWMVGAWDDVRALADRIDVEGSQIFIARVLLAMRGGDEDEVSRALYDARNVLGAPILAAGVKGLRRCYDAILDLHLTHELEVIHDTVLSLSGSSQRRAHITTELTRNLELRLDSTLPTFRTREPILSMRRTAFSLASVSSRTLGREIGRSWLASSKIARTAKQWQTAYSATLQARQSKAKFSFIQSAKLLKASGEPLRALQELENSMKQLSLMPNDGQSDVLDLTEDEDEDKVLKGKAQLLRARWMHESGRFDSSTIIANFDSASKLIPNWEGLHFHFGKFYDDNYKDLSEDERYARGNRIGFNTVKYYVAALKYGSKHVYQTVPRILTLWLDWGENSNKNPTRDEFITKYNNEVKKAIKDTAPYKWFTAFPQIVSRVGHDNDSVYKILSRIIITVLKEYPHQALWFFMSVVKSKQSMRSNRGQDLLNKIKGDKPELGDLIDQSLQMTNELLKLCDSTIKEDSSRLSMKEKFPRLAKIGRCQLIIPLQESLTATLPPASTSEKIHQPFPLNAPTFAGFADEVEIMKSLAKPRKITIKGSNGQTYMFLGKPKDDLRKDARLMDFNAIINKRLKANSESRRRQLHIRTYGVVTLNEECGFIQWVPNTIPIRPVLLKAYDARRIQSWNNEMNIVFKKIKDANMKEGKVIFEQRILPMFPPVFHEWFIETFPEPSAWLASRLAFGRTTAVMCMVGHVLGLGDRHCENILLDTNTGDIVHVDFNCLFEKAKTLEIPERVPFRLTQNMVDGLGITGVEGVFRIACEVTMQLLRDNKDSLMSVLDAFVHDPLVEWEDAKKKMENRDRRNSVREAVDLTALARQSLGGIDEKLRGVYVPDTVKDAKEREKEGLKDRKQDREAVMEKERQKELSTSNLVQLLIQDACNNGNLAKMYPGWAPWH